MQEHNPKLDGAAHRFASKDPVASVSPQLQTQVVLQRSYVVQVHVEAFEYVATHSLCELLQVATLPIIAAPQRCLGCERSDSWGCC